jgi:hypothetical protein
MKEIFVCANCGYASWSQTNSQGFHLQAKRTEPTTVGPAVLLVVITIGRRQFA